MLPCSGDSSSSAPPAPLDAARSRRGLRAVGTAPAPLATATGASMASPSTRTSKRFPETSTV
jgi:hypothetical protein